LLFLDWFLSRSWCRLFRSLYWNLRRSLLGSFLSSRFFGNYLGRGIFDCLRLWFRLSYRVWLWLGWYALFSWCFFGRHDRIGLRGSNFFSWCSFWFWLRFLCGFFGGLFLLCCRWSGFRFGCWRFLCRFWRLFRLCFFRGRFWCWGFSSSFRQGFWFGFRCWL